MRSVEDHLARVTAAAVAPRPVRVGISEAQGLMCAEEVVVETALPAFDQAAIDGYAVRSVDVADAGAEDDHGNTVVLTLPVVGEVSAGNRQPIRLQPGQAVRVETGAPLPTLADAVLPEKWTDGGLSKTRVGHPVRSGQYVRRTGDDVQPGDVAVRRGTVVGPAQVGLLAAVGRELVSVYPRPRVAVISVGRELVDIDRQTAAGQVYDVASYALAAAAADCGAEVHRVGIVGGDDANLKDVVEAQLQRSEVVVITSSLGGAASDSITAALTDLGDLNVDRIAMHPASVQGFGVLGEDQIPTFLLPSNPMSALVAFEVMVRPLVRIALGKRAPMRRLVSAKCAAAFASPAGRRGYMRGQLMRDEETGEFMVAPIPDNGAHLLVTLAEANCLIVVDPEVTEVRAGDDVVVAFLAQRG